MGNVMSLCFAVSALFLMTKVTEPWSAHQRHPVAISEFTTDIQDVAGKANPEAVGVLVCPVHPGILALLGRL